MTYRQLIAEIKLKAAYNPEVLDQDVTVLDTLQQYYPARRVAVTDANEDTLDPGHLFIAI